MLDFLIKHLRTIYTAQRRFAYLQHTGYTAVPVKFRRAEWERAVLFFVQHKLNFQRCVKARFDAERRKATSTFYVHPNSLASEKYLPLYQEAQLTLRDEIEAEFETQKNICRDYLLVTAPAYKFVTRTDALRFTLFNSSLNLSNLFRYGLSVAEGLSDVAFCYQDAALGQYLLAPVEYDAVWKGFIPEEFKRMAIGITGGVLHYA